MVLHNWVSRQRSIEEGFVVPSRVLWLPVCILWWLPVYVCKISRNENLNMIFRFSLHFWIHIAYIDRTAYKQITFYDGFNVIIFKSKQYGTRVYKSDRDSVPQKMAVQDDVNGKGAAMTSLKLICENKQRGGVWLIYVVLWHELPRFMLPAVVTADWLRMILRETWIWLTVKIIVGMSYWKYLCGYFVRQNQLQRLFTVK